MGKAKDDTVYESSRRVKKMGALAKIIADNKQTLKKLLPIELLRKCKKAYLNGLINRYKKEEIDQSVFEHMPKGVNLIGDIRSEIGLGQSIRLIANELDEAEIPFGIVDFHLDANLRRGDHSWDHKIREDFPYRVNLFHVNPQEIALAYLYLDKQIWKNRYNIAFWLWELEEFPKEHLKTLEFFDEIWTPSEFASASIRKVTDKPVVTIPYHVLAEADTTCDRSSFGLPEDKFLYLVMYDTNSTMERKNPVAAVESYKMAFPKEHEDVGIIIKMNNATEEHLAVIRKQLEGYKNVYFITEVLDKPKVNSLISCADVFISLHRAEGFGLVMAEAMLLGTACIATNWSSNTEFMNSDVAGMVDYQMVTITQTSGNYTVGNRWADADVKQASEFARRFYEDNMYYQETVQKAKVYVEDVLGKERICRLLKEHLKL